ncbi:hypothetical protein DICPUDRAFT_16409, partial [Dictyostelium purpureum]
MNQIHATFKKGITNITQQCNVNSILTSTTRNCKTTTTKTYNPKYFTTATTSALNLKNKNIKQLNASNNIFNSNCYNNDLLIKREYATIGNTPPNRQSVSSTSAAAAAPEPISQSNVANPTLEAVFEEKPQEQEQQKQQQQKQHNKENQEKGEQEQKKSNIFNSRNVTIGVLALLAISTKIAFDPPKNMNYIDFAFVRNLRVLYAGFKITFYYKYYLFGLNRGDPGYAENIQLAHRDASRAMVQLCELNKGIFIKIAQILASLDHILPVEYTKTLSVFQDHAPYEAFDQVEKLFIAETGKHPDEIFVDFERIPINSASLAQVHKAKLKLENGELAEVAVKVQYPGLNGKFQKDLDSVNNVLDYVCFFFPSFTFSWLLPEATSCLQQELDFVNEGKNSEKMAHLFKDNQQLSVPKVYWENTTKRILTMEFIHGVRIDNKEGLNKLGIDFKELYYLFSDIFAEQIFVHGFLHSDPHPGNIFVRKTSKGKPEIVLLDHGLYREIDDQVRLDFCHFWKSLSLGDMKSSQYYAERLGAGQFSKHLGTLLNLKPEESRENLRNMKRELGDQTLMAINSILQNLPKEILLVLKTNNLIRQITTHFGIENGFLNMAKTCIKGIYNDNTILSKLKYYVTLCIFNIEIKLINYLKKNQ